MIKRSAYQLLCALALVGSASLTGCSVDSAETAEESSVGQLSMALSSSSNGTTYRLWNANFDLQGPTPTVLSSSALVRNSPADAQGIRNVSPVLGTFTDPRLPKGKIDLILLVDVYHEFSHPEQMLAAMREALAPEGVCVLVEFRSEDPKVPIKPEHKMSREQIMKEWPKNGFKLVKEFDGLPWQHMLWFGRDDAAGETGEEQE